MLMNPMVLMMVLPLLLITVLPKMMNDPETKREMEQMQQQMNVNSQVPTQVILKLIPNCVSKSNIHFLDTKSIENEYFSYFVRGSKEIKILWPIYCNMVRNTFDGDSRKCILSKNIVCDWISLQRKIYTNISCPFWTLIVF